METKIFAPWYTLQKKIAAFFAYDDEVEVFDLVGASTDFKLPILVKTAAKAFSIQRAMKAVYEYGNVTVTPVIDCEEIGDTLAAAFEGNLLVRKIQDEAIPGGIARFVELEPEVLQFVNDDTSSPAGLSTYLAQDVAREIFDVFPQHGFICTVDIMENKDEQKVQPD